MKAELVNKVREIIFDLLSKTFLSRAYRIDVDTLPVYTFKKDEIEPIFYSINNMLKINGGGILDLSGNI